MPQILGDLRHHRCRAGAGAAAHAGGDEHHVGAGEHFGDTLAVVERRLAPDLGVGAAAEALGEVGTELQNGARAGFLERLRVGVGVDELHAVDVGADHVVDGIATAAAHADHLDHGQLAVGIHEFEHICCLLCAV